MSGLETLDSTPERLSDERLGELLAGFGNHEGKALLLLAMELGAFYSQGELHKLIADLPGANTVYIGSKTNQIDWCKSSLEPIGAVTRADYGEILRFSITEEGERLGKPLAGTLLAVADKYELSLKALFGATMAPKASIRSPLTRFFIAETLLTSDGPARVEEVAEANSKINRSTVTDQLLDLATRGLIHYDAYDFANDSPIYHMGKERDNPSEKRSRYTTISIDYLKESGQASLNELTANCYEKLTSEEKQDATFSEVREKIRDSLSQMASKGSIVKKGRNSHGGRVWLDEQQKAMWTELITVLEDFRDQNPTKLRKMLKTSKRIMSDRFSVPRALERAFETSPSAATGTEKDLGTLAIKALAICEGEISTRDIVSKIMEMSGRKVSPFGVQLALRPYIELGVLNFEKYPGTRINRYSLAQDKNLHR